MNVIHTHYSYSVRWSTEDNEYLGLCAEFPSLSWLAETQEEAFSGITQLVLDVIVDMQQSGEEEQIPTPLAEKKYSGEFRVRIPPEVHRALAIQAAEQRISLNRLVSARLTG